MGMGNGNGVSNQENRGFSVFFCFFTHFRSAEEQVNYNFSGGKPSSLFGFLGY
jgi:hypothetical protein